MPHSSTEQLVSPADERFTEAARYALLRRLAPALRHNMAGALQPISMMAAMLEKRLQKPEPDMLALGKNSNALNTLSREASLSCMSLMTWLAPKDNDAVPVNTGLEDSVSLLVTELSFRGFSVDNQTAAAESLVSRSVLRNVFMGALIALTDAAHAPAKVTLSAHLADDALLIGISLTPLEGEVMPGSAAAYRNLDWQDVEALAAADGVSLTHGPTQVELCWTTN